MLPNYLDNVKKKNCNEKQKKCKCLNNYDF